MDVLTRMRVDQGPNGPASAGGGRSCPRVAGNSSAVSVVSSVGEGVGVGVGVGLALRTQTSLPRFLEQVKTQAGVTIFLPALAQGAPGLGAAATGALSSDMLRATARAHARDMPKTHRRMRAV